MKTLADLNLIKKSGDEIKVSIITAVFNARTHLRECISSVLDQNYDNIEYIIIDGGSTDGSVNIIKEFDSKLTYWVSESDRGIYDAWNKGLAKSSGDWIAFIGADDVLLPNAVETYVKHICNHNLQEQLEFVSSKIQLVEEDLSFIKLVGEEWKWDLFKKRMNTWHVGMFHSKKLFKKYGLFDSSYKISGDYELLLRPKDQLITSFIEHTTVMMRVGGISDVNLIKASEETYRAKIKNKVLSLGKGNFLRLFDRFRLLVRLATGLKGF